MDLMPRNQPAPAGQCQYWLKNKRRFCKFPIHESGSSGGGSNENNNSRSAFCVFHAKDDESRVPCPLDVNHTVLKHELQRHLTKCSSRQTQDLPAWHRHDCNLSLLESSVGHEEQQQWEGQTRHILEECTIPEMQEMMDVARKVTASLDLQEDVREHAVLNDRVAAAMKIKHSRQQSSLLGHLQHHGLLDSNHAHDDDDDDGETDTLFIEWGAGKAELSRYLARAVSMHRQSSQKPGEKHKKKKKESSAKFLLIDRESPRLKHDGRIRADWAESHGAEPDASASIDVRRFKVDIAHLDLDLLLQTEYPNTSLPCIRSVSKHLCGAATDLTMASLDRCSAVHQGRGKSGILIALCCHHICSWPALTPTTRNFLAQAGCTTPRQFDILKHMTSWHTSGLRDGMSVEATGTHRTGLSHAERDHIGWMCKRTIDLARVSALQEAGWSARLIKYQSESITTECVALLATKSTRQAVAAAVQTEPKIRTNLTPECSSPVQGAD